MLHLTNLSRIVVIVVLYVQLPFVYSHELDYKLRGNNRHEGIAPEPVSGNYGIELLSALIFNPEKWKPIPKDCKLKFYLPKQTDANSLRVRVQEVNPHEFYFMKPIKKFPWKQGSNNFQWPTDVIQKVPLLEISKLGVIADLKPNPDMKEPKYIAPVMFYHSSIPTEANAYSFVFKVGNKNAKLGYAIHKGDNQKPLIERSLGEKSVGIPFVIFWDSSKASEGTYKLVVKGKRTNDFTKISQSVYFYHKPLID